MVPSSQRAVAPPPDTATVSHLGIRYAALSTPGDAFSSPVPVPVSGSRKPRPSDLRDVAVFPQLPSRLAKLMGPGVEENPQDHNAFFLNVFAPATGRDLPVVVFLHGGAWSSGAGAARWYRGTELAVEGMVVITVNYRLGPAGHLATGREPHRPFDELVLALRWVRDHAADYGADIRNITVAGQSAGAWYAWMLAQDPRARGLMRQVALWSMPQIEPWSQARRADFTRTVTGQDPELLTDPDRYPELMRATAATLSTVPRDPGMMPPMLLPSVPAPARGAAALHEAVRRLHVQQVYVRDTSHEMSPFLALETLDARQRGQLLRQLAHQALGTGRESPWPHEALPPESSAVARQSADIIRYSSWLAFGQQADAIASACRQQGRKVVLRRFAGTSALPGVGGPHCFDLPFQFGNFPDWHDAPMLDGIDTEMMRRWSRELREDLLEFGSGQSSPDRRMLGA
ncbi:carboxylesterase family protein [Glutamicibacter sp. MNS18]|uniref:carboxylesterase family protein n=1 Tax=Glutamicibacter sp. MNS18 TaxID=2989817 RepID=UPI002236338B|nr:carboxylesterase family protein [Glutamicibacter sp. MNS18]MCW4467215.1 carboxylesterase family protein [Glutamicibacter sp. MNS18]